MLRRLRVQQNLLLRQRQAGVSLVVPLTDEQWKVFEMIAEEQPHPVVAPLRDIVAELTVMGLVATDAQGRWITTPQGDMLYRDRQDRPLH
jgi:hypothetical protein